MEDRLLVVRCKQGSREALRRIYEKYRDRMLILGIALSNDVNIAEDALHDSFIGFAEGLENFELTGSLRSYLATCVANRVRDLMRKKRSRPLPASESESSAAQTKEPLEEIVCNEELERLCAALAELPDEQREVVVLRVHEQMRFRTISKSLGISVNTAKGRYRYGVRKLRSILNSEYET